MNLTLNDLQKGECAKILNIESNSTLKSRFKSFGITKGSLIYVIEHTMSKKTIEIKINNTKIALRSSEAQTVIIEKSQCLNEQ